MKQIYVDHFLDLNKSGISAETADENGLFSVQAGDVTKSPVGMDTKDKTWLIFPYNHTPRFFRAKWFPSPEVDGKKVKYYQEPGSGVHLYIPRYTEEYLRDVNMPLYITEGEKKALKAAQDGICCLALGGLHNWHLKGLPALIADFDLIKLRNRDVFIVPDNDFRLPKHKGHLVNTVKELAYNLSALGAKVFIKYLPKNNFSFGEPNYEKAGLDDYLVKYGRAEFDRLPHAFVEIQKRHIHQVTKLHPEEGDLKNVLDGEVISSWALAEILHQERTVKPPKRLETCFQGIDHALGGGIKPGSLVVVAGKSGEGKSTFCKSWTAEISKKDSKCLWFAFEGTESDFIDSFGDDLPFFYVPKNLTSTKIDWILERIKEAVTKFGDIDLVFIDNLNYMTFGLREKSLAEEIKTIIHKTVEASKIMGFTPVIMHNLVKSANHPDAIPNIADIREAAVIIDYASEIFMIWRTEYEDSSILQIQKSRSTGTRKKIHLVKKGLFLYEEIV